MTKKRIGEIMKAALQVLEENDGQLPSREVVARTGEKLDLTDEEKAPYEKSGYIRWESHLHFYSINCVKAGWLRKKKGVWYLTDEGRQALDLDPLDLVNASEKKYREWKAKQKPDVESEEDEKKLTLAYEQAIAAARAEIEERIESLGAYEFQDLVAALLRGMGYYTPFVAPKGKDMGIDIIAYKDPLGSAVPRLKVQVKHRKEKVSVKEVRELVSLLGKEGDAGLLVSSGGFTADSQIEIRRSTRHVEKIDLDDLITLWEDYYDKLSEEDRALLPLRRVAFLAPPG